MLIVHVLLHVKMVNMEILILTFVQITLLSAQMDFMQILIPTIVKEVFLLFNLDCTSSS